MTTLESKTIRAMHRALAEFGYNIDEGHVTQYAEHLMAGNKPTNGPSMFIENWLREAGMLGEARQ